MLLALAAYATYVINAAQFLLKLRAARLDERADAARPSAPGAARMNAPMIAGCTPRPTAAAPTRRCCASAASARCSAA